MTHETQIYSHTVPQLVVISHLDYTITASLTTITVTYIIVTVSYTRYNTMTSPSTLVTKQSLQKGIKAMPLALHIIITPKTLVFTFLSIRLNLSITSSLHPISNNLAMYPILDTNVCMT